MLISISLLYGVNLWYFKTDFKVWNKKLSKKFGCKNIRTWKSEFIAQIQFFCLFSAKPLNVPVKDYILADDKIHLNSL